MNWVTYIKPFGDSLEHYELKGTATQTKDIPGEINSAVAKIREAISASGKKSCSLCSPDAAERPFEEKQCQNVAGPP